MERLQIREISRQLAQTQHMSIGDAERFVTEMFSTICEGLKQDKQVIINGFGTFKMSQVKEKEIVTFTPDSEIAQQINAPFANFKTVEITVDVPDEDVEGYKPEASNLIEPLDTSSMADDKEDETEGENENPASAEQPAVEEKVDALTEKVEALTEEIENKKKRKKTLSIASVVISLIAIAVIGGSLFVQHRKSVEEAAEKERIAAVKAAEVKQKQDSINKIKTMIDSIELTDEQKLFIVGKGKDGAPVYPCDMTLVQAKEMLPKGGYNITGTVKVVEVQPGQTLQDVADENGLQQGIVYVQVHNALESVKEGQKIRIPLIEYK